MKNGRKKKWNYYVECSQCGELFRHYELIRFKKTLWCPDCLNKKYEPEEIPTWKQSSISNG
jgi:formylmethanofuran dehydrogenase subunit E